MWKLINKIQFPLSKIILYLYQVRDELENLLDDDMDMAEMYLTDKLVHLGSEEIASKDEINKDAFDSDGER